MKKQMIPGCIMLALSVVISVGSFTFLGPCVHEDGSMGTCWWAGRALMGLGYLLGVLSVLALLSERACFGACLSSVAVCILGMMTPGTLISLCKMSSMHCRAVMQPAMMILFAVSGLAALAGAWLCRKAQMKKA